MFIFRYTSLQYITFVFSIQHLFHVYNVNINMTIVLIYKSCKVKRIYIFIHSFIHTLLPETKTGPTHIVQIVNQEFNKTRVRLQPMNPIPDSVTDNLAKEIVAMQASSQADRAATLFLMLVLLRRTSF